jgi:hypothetical protein
MRTRDYEYSLCFPANRAYLQYSISNPHLMSVELFAYTLHRVRLYALAKKS